ncbi:MAG: hypothetical protein R2828_20110 [Saprospiraceae bacterium]
MKSILQLGFGLLFLFNMVACGSRAGGGRQDVPTVFFDLRTYFEGEIERLKAQGTAVRKEIEMNGKTEVQTQEALDFEKEFAIFVRSDINKPAWRNKYKVDSVMNANQLLSLQYTAIDSSLKTRILTIEFKAAEVARISIFNKSDSPLIKAEQRLTFEPDRGYHIRNSQVLSLSKDSELSIAATFLKEKEDRGE